MRWWWILCVSLLWRTATPKAVREIDNVSEASNTRLCCPCPEPGQGNTARSLYQDQSSLRSLAYPDQDPFGSSLSARTSPAYVDDCPCRPSARDADSAGAQSMLFPSAMRAIRPFVSLEDEKEESKPLLHPEVNLASSVLETLRQATDEEYEDALARDAARSVARAMEPDTVVQGVRNLIPVLISPKRKNVADDGEVLEASNIKETRFTVPSLKRKMAFNKPLDMDSDVGASNVHENVAPVPQTSLNAKPNTDPLNIIPESNILKNTRLSIPKLSDVVKSIEDTLLPTSRSSLNADDVKTGSKHYFPKLFDAAPILIPANEKVDEMRKDTPLDNTNSPSNIKETYSIFNNRKNTLSEKSAENPSKGNNEVLEAFSNIKNKLLSMKIPDLKLKPENRDAASDLLSDIIKTLEQSRSLLPFNTFNTQSKTTSTIGPNDENTDVKNTVLVPTVSDPFSTVVVDKASASSTPNVSPIECSGDAKVETKNSENIRLNPNVHTEIIDSIPSTSNVHEIIDDGNESNKEDSSAEPTIADNNSDVGFFTSDTDVKENESDVNDGSEEIDENNNDFTDHFSSERENCSEYEDVASAGSSTSNSIQIPKPSKDKSVDDTIIADNFKRFSVSSHEENENETKSVDDEENCDPFDKLNDKDNALPRNGNHHSQISKTVSEKNPNLEDDSKSCETSENLKDENSYVVSPKGKILEQLNSLKKSRNKLNPQKLTSNIKRNEDASRQLSIDDLQNMSNSLLDQEKVLINALAERNNVNKPKDLKYTNSVKTDKHLEVKDANIAESNTVSQTTSNNENKCLTDTLQEKSNEGKRNNEMMSEASERVGIALKPETIPRSSLLPNIVEPTSLFDGSTNLFNLPTVSLSDIFRNPLPSLRIPKIFGEVNSARNENENFDRKDSGMSSLASTSNSRSILAPLSALEDLNLDILQLKPLGLPESSSLPLLPRLNLNHYKTKLAIPKSLPLKPVFLESSVSNKKGMIGASMNFGKGNDGMKPKYSSKNMVSDILANPIALPSFDDLQENLLENAHNLLSTPLETTGRNLIEDTFRSGHVLTENIKVQAKNAVDEFHKNLESKFKSSGSILGKPLKNSNIIEEISRKHEDLGDKLKGIHHDFSDRLETLRNDILDKMPSLESQMARQSSNLKSLKQPLRVSSRPNKSRVPATRSKNVKKSDKPKKNKSLNMVSSSSMISPKFAESPKSSSFSSGLDIEKLNKKGTDSVLSSNIRSRPLLDVFHKPQSSLLSKSFLKPKLKENKVKITFETTPRPVIEAYPSTTRNNIKSKSSLPGKSLPNNEIRDKTVKSVSDAYESPSEMKPVYRKTPLKVPIKANAVKPESELKVTPIALKSKLPITPHRKNPIFNKSLEPLSSRAVEVVKQKSTGRSTLGSKPLKAGLSEVKSTTWPRVIDDDFLKNVREAVRSRLASMGSVKHRTASKLGKTEPIASDMARSASNAVEVSVPITEAMKENTSYTCQMVCTKNN